MCCDCKLSVLSKCCCCIPLRIGLIIWGYLRLILASLYLLVLLYGVSTQFGAKGLAVLLALLSFLVANVVFTITFIIGAHKKNYKLLRIYYTFNIFSLILSGMGFIISVTLQVVLTSDKDLDLPSLALDGALGLPCLTTGINILLDLYFVLLVRREILKLKNHRTYFVNRGQAETRNITSVYTDSESEEDVVVNKSLFPVQELENLKRDLEHRRK